MNFFGKIGAQLRESNEALATAHKAWRDDGLAQREEAARDREAAAREREQSLASHQAAVSEQLAEIRRLEGRRWRRKFVYLSIAILAAVPSFVLGGILERSNSASSADPVSAVAETDLGADFSEPAATTAEAKIEAPAPAEAAPAPALDPDAAAEAGAYGTGSKFDVGKYCLDKEAQGELSFDECLGAAAVAFTASR